MQLGVFARVGVSGSRVNHTINDLSFGPVNDIVAYDGFIGSLQTNKSIEIFLGASVNCRSFVSELIGISKSY